METRERIAEILQWLDKGVVRRAEVHIHVGFALAEAGSVNDVGELPLWIREELAEWAREFEESKTWWLISSNGERDASDVGLKLLALLKNAGLVA
jgi:hypothetical protein